MYGDKTGLALIHSMSTNRVNFYMALKMEKRNYTVPLLLWRRVFTKHYKSVLLISSIRLITRYF